MAEKLSIKIAPEVLLSQAQELEKLCSEFESLHAKTVKNFTEINSHWSETLSKNFSLRVSDFSKDFKALTESLITGYETARESAATFVDVDTILTKRINTSTEDLIAGGIVYANSSGALNFKASDELIEAFYGILTGSLSSKMSKFEATSNLSTLLGGVFKNNSAVFECFDELSSGLGSTLNTYSHVSDVFSGLNALKNMRQAYGSGDVDKMFTGTKSLVDVGATEAEIALESIIEQNAWLKLGIDYGKNVVNNTIDDLRRDVSAGEVVFDSFGKSMVDTFNDVVLSDSNVSLAWYPAKAISGLLGYDLLGAYEKASGKKGFEAVTSTIKDTVEGLHEIITFDNWKSGMANIFAGLF